MIDIIIGIIIIGIIIFIVSLIAENIVIIGGAIGIIAIIALIYKFPRLIYIFIGLAIVGAIIAIAVILIKGIQRKLARSREHQEELKRQELKKKQKLDEIETKKKEEEVNIKIREQKREENIKRKNRIYELIVDSKIIAENQLIEFMKEDDIELIKKAIEELQISRKIRVTIVDSSEGPGKEKLYQVDEIEEEVSEIIELD